MKAKIELQNLPMLCEKYYPGAVEFPVWVEWKYNGIRCVIIVPDSSSAGAPRAYSREGRALEAGAVAAAQIARLCGPGVYDGELVAASFRLTLSAVKRRDPSGLRFKCWDHLHLCEWLAGRSRRTIPERRMGLLGLMAAPWTDTVDRVVDLVPGGFVRSEEQLREQFDRAIRKGWEGLVIKKLLSWYVCNERSRSWMKMKPAGVE